RREPIRIKGARDVVETYKWTQWGPIVSRSELEKPLAFHWVAHDPAATDLGLLDLETAANAREAVTIAHHAGVPAVNLFIADRDGTIAWTIAGRLPNRVGYDGRLPVAWTYGDRRWDGLLPPDEVPSIIVPARGAPILSGAEGINSTGPA